MRQSVSDKSLSFNEKSQSVCNFEGWVEFALARVVALWEGVWCSTHKTKWHRSDPQIVSDKDAAKRAAWSAPTINRNF